MCIILINSYQQLLIHRKVSQRYHVIDIDNGDVRVLVSTDGIMRINVNNHYGGKVSIYVFITVYRSSYSLSFIFLCSKFDMLVSARK